MSSARVLVVDDEASIRFAVRRLLEQLGYEVAEAPDCRAAERAVEQHVLDAAVVDYQLTDGTALDILPRFVNHEPRIPVVVLTGHGSIELAVRCIQQGADHFLTKPIDLPALSALVARLVEVGRIERHQKLDESKRTRRAPDPFVGESDAIRELEAQARRVTASDATVLIQGETGSGKGVLVRWIHDVGDRSGEPLVELNCAVLSRDLLESELFGHARGAFTGAVKEKAGLLEVAHRGTVFLDEIGDMDADVQPKLLKALEDSRVRRVGGVKDRSIDVRVVAATHRDLGRAVTENQFRSDLYYRLSTVTLSVPPLRERREDIPVLARDLLDGLAAEAGALSVQLLAEAMERLRAYDWPGNIRELKNVLERAVLLSDSHELGPDDLRFDASGPAAPPSASLADRTLEDVQRTHIERVLRVVDGRVAEAARRLDVPRSTLYDYINRFEIDLSEFRTNS